MTYVKMLQNILSTSHWTQEQLATQLGVSFATINSWLNKRSVPRETMQKRIQKLYLAQDISGEAVPAYVTVVNIDADLRPEDYMLLEKDIESDYDDESIRCTVVELSESDSMELTRRKLSERQAMYVANSVSTVARGTQSAGRIYDKINGVARAQVMFIVGGVAIAKIIDWGKK